MRLLSDYHGDETNIDIDLNRKNKFSTTVGLLVDAIDYQLELLLILLKLLYVSSFRDFIVVLLLINTFFLYSLIVYICLT
jgi:hypothetical protein